MTDNLSQLSNDDFIAELKNAITDDEANFWGGPESYEFRLMNEALRRCELLHAQYDAMSSEVKWLERECRGIALELERVGNAGEVRNGG